MIGEKMLKENIKAVHDNDLSNLLKSLEIYDEVMSGQKKCKFCGDVIDFNNLETIFPESGDIKFGCNKNSCLSQLYDFINAKGLRPND